MDLLSSCGITDDNLFLSHILYKQIISKFQVEIHPDEYGQFLDFQECVYDLIEELHKLGDTLTVTLDEIMNIDNYLSDVIIMCWCLPRAGLYSTNIVYTSKYRDNIKKYQDKMINLIESKAVATFCIDVLSKTNYIPIHCIDYLWYYMDDVEFQFFNSGTKNDIGLKRDAETVILGFNMESVFHLGLGQIVFESKIRFINFLFKLITDEDNINALLSTDTSGNYRTQRLNILSNFHKYNTGIEYTSNLEKLKGLVSKYLIS